MNKPILFLAPMAGYTDLPFRLLAQENGADAGISEMVSAKGIYYGDRKTGTLYRSVPEERGFGLQIFGSEPPVLKEAVEILEESRKTGKARYNFIDFNAGCPAPKIVKNGDGSALLNDLPLLERCVGTIKEAAGVPVSVKTRIGFGLGDDRSVDIAKAIESGGADMITIHGRSREQYYSGLSDWESVAQAAGAVDVPVTLSGDINSPEDAKRALETTGVDNLMVGRAALENPMLFSQIKDYLETGEYKQLNIDEKFSLVLRHLTLVKRYNDNIKSVVALRKHLAAYTKGMPGAALMRQRIFEATNFEEIIDIFSASLQNMG